MKTRKSALVALFVLASANMLGGGLFTNTNQNPIFFRQPAQNAIIGVQGAYYDPAGLVFMNEGLHFGLGEQMAFQTRTITSSYAPFALNRESLGQSVNEYKGSTFAPVIPSLDLAYNKNRWAASLHFGVVSGGGSCAFDDGLGSFEAPMALLPAAVNTLAGSEIMGGYQADINFTGKSFGFGGQFNYSYKVFDDDFLKLSLAAGIRLNYLKNQYDGGIFNYQLYMNQMQSLLPAGTALQAVLSQILSVQMPAQMAQQTAQGIAQQLGADKEVSCTQTGFAYTPVLNAHLQAGIVDLAVKYEFRTKVTLKNETDINSTGIAAYEDGVESRADMPALLSTGINVNFLPTLRLAAAMNVYFDKDADYNGRQELLGGNTLEWTAGLEYDLTDKLTMSLGTQITRFDFGENNGYLTDSSFSLPSWCLGGGFRYWFTDRLAIDLSAFNTFYDEAEKSYTDYGNAGATYAQKLEGILPAQALAALKVPGNDSFKRTSLNFALGIVWDF